MDGPAVGGEDAVDFHLELVQRNHVFQHAGGNHHVGTAIRYRQMDAVIAPHRMGMFVGPGLNVEGFDPVSQRHQIGCHPAVAAADLDDACGGGGK